jgi:hypothetical protein
VSRRLLVPLGLAVAGLVALAAVAARGRPLGVGGRGAGPTASFFDYVFTTVVILAVAIVLAVLVSLPGLRRAEPAPRKRRSYVASLVGFAAALAVVWALSHSGFVQRFQALDQQANKAQPGRTHAAPPPAPAGTRNARIRWDEVAIVLGLLGATVALGLATRSGRRLATLPSLLRSRQQAVSAALDESLDDLRGEPDLRRAIVAAYARMERALAVSGLPRRPAEAPLEYLERALLALDTSAAAVARLTELFERAKFSQHEPDPQMRDEAIDALVAVRDELRTPTVAA